MNRFVCLYGEVVEWLFFCLAEEMSFEEKLHRVPGQMTTFCGGLGVRFSTKKVRWCGVSPIHPLVLTIQSVTVNIGSTFTSAQRRLVGWLVS